jgi:hypothetical protein
MLLPREPAAQAQGRLRQNGNETTWVVRVIAALEAANCPAPRRSRKGWGDIQASDTKSDGTPGHPFIIAACGQCCRRRFSFRDHQPAAICDLTFRQPTQG